MCVIRGKRKEVSGRWLGENDSSDERVNVRDLVIPIQDPFILLWHNTHWKSSDHPTHQQLSSFPRQTAGLRRPWYLCLAIEFSKYIDMWIAFLLSGFFSSTGLPESTYPMWTDDIYLIKSGWRARKNTERWDMISFFNIPIGGRGLTTSSICLVRCRDS